MDLWNNKVGRKIGIDLSREMKKKYKLGNLLAKNFMCGFIINEFY